MRSSGPVIRPRRLRASPAMRAMTRETVLTSADFVQPIFLAEGLSAPKPVPSMPGVFQLPIEAAVEEAKRVFDLGIPGVILFGIPEHKDLEATGAWHASGVVQRGTAAIKRAVPDLLVIADTCLCEYTSHGHCGYLRPDDHVGDVLNDATLALLGRVAVAQAEAGADVIAPSGMMDGFVAAIRAQLDGAGFSQTPIMAYSAKYASSYYGPFRDAADSAPALGDRRTYQMDPANRREAIKEVLLDVAEGADIVMVKPALAYLDIVAAVKAATHLPVAAYNVSGEYAMVKAAALQGWIDEERVVLETLTSFKRAGADIILTYHAKDATRWLRR
jgi:porphobilinogen synthase